MPVEYLSDAWLDAADRLLHDHGPLNEALAHPFAIETVVTGAPGGTRRYVVRFDADGASVDRTPGATANVRLTQPWDVAVAIARGERSAQAAFLAAEIQVGGEVGSLIAHASMVGAIGDALAPLRTSTSYPTA